MPNCSQCNTPAVFDYSGNPMCVRHHLMMQQAAWIQFAQSAAWLNFIEGQIAQGTGYILPPNYISIPAPPRMGDNLTFNNINVTDSNVGMVNTGTIQKFEHLDASVSVFQQHGDDALAEALRDFTQRLWDGDLEPTLKEEIAQHVEYLAAQAQAEPERRSMGVARSVVRGVSETLRETASLAGAWTTLQPLLERAIGLLG